MCSVVAVVVGDDWGRGKALLSLHVVVKNSSRSSKSSGGGGGSSNSNIRDSIEFYYLIREKLKVVYISVCRILFDA